MPLTKDSLISKIPIAWRTILQEEFRKSYWNKIVDTLNDEDDYYPKENDIFNALKSITPDDVKVILLGQDPYPTKDVAHGYSFSVRRRTKIPPSLKNIFKELGNEYKIPFEPKHGDISAWERDGVLLLNTILTVSPSMPLSHKNIGWEEFTGAILKYFKNKSDVLFLLLGTKARDAIKSLDIDFSRIIYAGHPSARNLTGSFLGSDCFIKVNDELYKRKKLPIRWLLL